MKQVFACSSIMLLAACSGIDEPETIDAALDAIVVSEPVPAASGAPAGVRGSRSLATPTLVRRTCLVMRTWMAMSTRVI